LLTDAGVGEEFDTAVDEITDEYLQHDLSDEERERVQQYFLSSTERQRKLEFARELLRRAAERDDRSGFFERIVAFFKEPSFARVALTAAGVIIVAGIIFLVVSRDKTTNYLALNLTINASERAEGAEVTKVKLPANTGLRVTLTIPPNARGANEYEAKLVGGSELKTEPRTEETVTVTIPAGTLKPGAYAIQLFKDKQRVTGSYFFAVEP